MSVHGGMAMSVDPKRTLHKESGLALLPHFCNVVKKSLYTKLKIRPSRKLLRCTKLITSVGLYWVVGLEAIIRSSPQRLSATTF